MTAFYYNIRTGQVEQLASKGQSKDLLGPYTSRESAQQALDLARQRTEQWDEQESELNGD